MYDFLNKCRDFKNQYVTEGYYREIPVAAAGRRIGSRECYVKNVGRVLSFNSLEYLGDPPEHISEFMKSKVDVLGRNLACTPALLEPEEYGFLEQELSDFRGLSEDWTCCIFNTGFSGSQCGTMLLLDPLQVTGVRMSGRQRKVNIFFDKLIHASMQEAIFPYRKKSTKHQAIRWNHLDYGDLEEKLEKHKDDDCDTLIIVDSLFSMLGDFVDVVILHNLAKRYNAHILMDNAHSDGVYGSEGRGLLFEPGMDNLDHSIFFQIGTMSKAFSATQGGHFTLPKHLAYLAKRSIKARIFSVGLPPFLIEVARESLKFVRGSGGDERRKRLHGISQFARKTFLENDLDIQGSQSHIMSVLIGEGHVSVNVAEYILHEKKILTALVTAGTVEGGKSSLRIPLTASHTEEDINRLKDALVSARDRFHF